MALERDPNYQKARIRRGTTRSAHDCQQHPDQAVGEGWRASCWVLMYVCVVAVRYRRGKYREAVEDFEEVLRAIGPDGDARQKKEVR